MKKKFLAAIAAVVVAASVHAQSTVDSIEAKYKLQPMPAAMTTEEAFPVIGNYQLQNSTAGAGTLTVTLDPSNKGMVWVEGLPQGKIKAYLRQSPATYRILSQKTDDGKQVQEGTLYYDTTARTLHIAIGKSYNESDPTGLFANSTDMSSASTDMNTASTDNTEVKAKAGGTKTKVATKGNQTKLKSKTPAGKEKAKVWFYTATKVGQGVDMMNNNQTNQTQMSDSTQHSQTQASDSTHHQQ